MVGFVATLFALLRFLIPLGVTLGLEWVVVVSVLLLMGLASPATSASRRLDRSP